MKKTLIIILIIITLVAGGFVLVRGLSQRQMNALLADLEMESVQQGALSSIVGATGTVRSNQSAYLVWKVSGQVGQVLVDVGESVAAGDTLALLDKSSLPAYVILAQADLVETQNQLDALLNSSVQQAEALKAVEAAQQALEDALHPELAQAQALAAITAAEADLDTAQTHFEILTAPVSQGAIDQAFANFVLAENRLTNLQDDIAKYERKMKGPYTMPWESRQFYRDILDGLNMQLPYVQKRYDETLMKYNNLLEPPDPLDVAVAETAVMAAQAQLDDANLQYARIKDGYSPAEIAVLEAQLVDAQREYERVKDGVPAEDIAILEAQIAAFEATLQQTKITAPFGGTITHVEIQPGDQVESGSLAFRVDDFSTMLVDLDVSEIDIPLVQLGQNVIVTFDAILAKEYHGEVIEIAPVGDAASGITTFKVTVVIHNTDVDIRPGMTSEVSIVTSEVEDVLLIPNRAIRLLDGERVVYVLRDAPGNEASPLSGITPVSITLGTSSGLYSEVISGDLTIGDQIIINPPTDILASNQENGIRIEINP